LIEDTATAKNIVKRLTIAEVSRKS